MSHYFSRVRIKPDAVRFMLNQAGDVYREHALVWKLFPGDGVARDFLFRTDIDKQGMPVYYIVSRREPTLHEALIVETKPYDPQLQEGQYLGFELRASAVKQLKIERSPEQLKEFKERRKKEGLPEKKTKRRVYADVVMHEKKRLLEAQGFKYWADWPDTDEAKPALYELVQSCCLDWFEQHAKQAGFRLLTRELHDNEQRGVREEKSVRIDSYTQHRSARKGIRFSTVDFAGELEVTDTLAFRKILLNGIGHSKAFGCGLLLVRRI